MIWLDGVLQAATEARISPSDRGFLLGDGLFETIRVARCQTVHLDAHLQRLLRGAAVLGITPKLDACSIGVAIDQVIAADAVAEGSLRLTLTRGVGPRGVLPAPCANPTLMISASHGAAVEAAVGIIIATVTRRNEFSPLSRVKSLNYLDNILARRQACEQGADEAILLNTTGMVAEASCANLLVLKGGALLTPPVADGALPGVIRGCLLKLGLVCEASFAPSDLFEAEALFLCSALGIRAIASIDGRRVAGRTPLLAELRRKAAFEDHG